MVFATNTEDGYREMSTNDDDHVVRVEGHSFNGKKVAAVGGAILAVVLVMILLFTVILPSGGQADLMDALTCDVSKEEYSHHTAVRVTISGWITNNGGESAVAEVTIQVYDGSSWSTYSERTDTIQGDGGTYFFLWSENFPKDDETVFEVKHTVRAL